LGSFAWGIACDSGNIESLAGLAEKIKAITPRIDVLFCNELFDVLAKGTFFTTKAILPLMGEGGSIIFNTSVVTLYGSAYASVYSAAKAAVSSFIKTFAAESTARGIRVNGVSPGYTESKGFEKTGMDASQINAVIATVTPTLPFKRFGRAHEIAQAVSFLASDES
jgi:NAD(P)-dependent dehydrogenase (short-subunit alcohol dehydrogenase family)